MRTVALTADERAWIGELADSFLAEKAAEPNQLAERAAVTATELPVRLRRHLTMARVMESDLTMVSGLPVRENLPPTPANWATAAATAAGRREELVLLMCASMLADPFGWVGQQNGRLVHDVCPVRGMENGDTSASSVADLSLHTEDAFHRARGDYVGLFCLRNPDRTGTTFVRVSTLDLPANIERTLREHRFFFRPDNSHEMGDNPVPVNAEAILFGPVDHPYLRYDPDFASPENGDSVAMNAMSVLDGTLARVAEHVALAPGDAIFIDNYKVLHGRQKFRARYDGTDRWLKRVNLTRDIRRLHVDRSLCGRIVTG